MCEHQKTETTITNSGNYWFYITACIDCGKVIKTQRIEKDEDER